MLWYAIPFPISQERVAMLNITLRFGKRDKNKLDPVSRVTGIPGWYWILGMKCSDTTGVGLGY